MKYDFSFVNSNFKRENPSFEKVIEYIEKSIKLLNSDCKESVYILRRCCQTLVTVIGHKKYVKLENDLGHDIDILKSNKILDDDIYFKLNFIEREFIRLQTLNYTVSKEIAQKCLDNTYEFIKWFINNHEKDKDSKDKVSFTDNDLNIFDDYLIIKRCLKEGKKSIEYDKNDLEYSPDDSLTDSRKAVDHMVKKIQNKYDIQVQNELKEDIDSIEALIDKDILLHMNIVRLHGNDGVHPDKYGEFCDDEKKAINCLNLTYKVAKWYIDFINKPTDKIKPKKLHKKWNKNGKLEGTYDGSVLINKRSGYGKMYYENNNRYTGYWKDDKKHGKGTLKYDNGDEYEGQWKYDKKDGKGKMIYHNKEEYTGSWKDNKKHGQGKMICKDGSVYTGSWIDNKKNGIFKIVTSNKLIYEGECKDDEYIGIWKLTKLDGKKVDVIREGEKFIEVIKEESKLDNSIQKYNGEWKKEGSYIGEVLNCKRHGQGKMIYQDGSIYEGSWKEDVRSGQGRYVWKDGTIYEGSWKDDLIIGQGKYVLKDGTI